MSERQPPSDHQFTLELREAVQRYLLAVDAWEAAYGKFYRLPGYAGTISADLEEEQREYLASRRHLEGFLPRARGLCFKYGVRDPWVPLLKVSLGEHAPQQRDTSAIGRAERSAVSECLMNLAVASQEWAAQAPEAEAAPAARRSSSPSWLRRMVDFLY